MKRHFLLLLLIAAPVFAAERAAKNVILFIGDAAGIPTVNAASIHGYNQPRKLFIQNMPNIGLMETSPASAWVTDSAAAMTAIVTGRKTNNGVVSQSDAAVKGQTDGPPLKTILEYAEEHGLSTGVVSNDRITGATPAACYAHVNDRNKMGEIFLQALKPSYGDGVDVMIGAGRTQILEATGKLGVNLKAEMDSKKHPIYESLDAVPASARRAVVLLDTEDFDLDLATKRAIEILSRNPKGFFLMVESDCHTTDIAKGLDRLVGLDRIVKTTAERMKARDTLVVFTADHSYDFRVQKGQQSEPLIADSERDPSQKQQKSVKLKYVRRDDSHTGEEVMVAAQGPGAARVRGVFANTDLFQFMLKAYGWPAKEK